MSNYATKTDLQEATGVDLKSDVYKLAIDELKNVPSGLSSLKSKVNKLDVDKFKNVPSGLGSLKNKLDQLDIGKLETRLDNLEKNSWSNII